MSTQKIEQVNADSIVIFLSPNWYNLQFSGLVQIECVQATYGLEPKVEYFVPLNMITPVVDEKGNVAYPPAPALTEEVQLDMRIRLFRRVMQDRNTSVISSLKNLIDLFPSQFTDILAESLMP